MYKQVYELLTSATEVGATWAPAMRGGVAAEPEARAARPNPRAMPSCCAFGRASIRSQMMSPTPSVCANGW